MNVVFLGHQIIEWEPCGHLTEAKSTEDSVTSHDANGVPDGMSLRSDNCVEDTLAGMVLFFLLKGNEGIKLSKMLLF